MNDGMSLGEQTATRPGPCGPRQSHRTVRDTVSDSSGAQRAPPIWCVACWWLGTWDVELTPGGLFFFAEEPVGDGARRECSRGPRRNSPGYKRDAHSPWLHCLSFVCWRRLISQHHPCRPNFFVRWRWRGATTSRNQPLAMMLNRRPSSAVWGSEAPNSRLRPSLSNPNTKPTRAQSSHLISAVGSSAGGYGETGLGWVRLVMSGKKPSGGVTCESGVVSREKKRRPEDTSHGHPPQ